MDTPHEASRLEAISTRWSLLRRAHKGSTPSAVDARGAVVLRYLPAMRRYVGALLQNDQEAEDVTQDVVVRLMAGDFAGASPERGCFRDLLRVAIRNMVRNHWKRDKRRRAVDVDVAEVAGDYEADDRRWLAEWRRSVLDLAWKDLDHEQQSKPGSVAYTLLRLRIDYPDDTSEQLAARLSKTIGQPVRADAVRQKLRRARLQFVDLLLTEVASGLGDPTPERIEDELTALGLMDLIRELLPPDWKSRGRPGGK